MKAKLLAILVLAAALFLSGCTQQAAQQNGDGATAENKNPQTYIIEITADGFSPGKVTIKQGDTVKWVNNSYETGRWPASAKHPTHTVYPGSDIQKCGTAEQEGIFDACRGIPPGESFRFTFNDKGSWGFHDHTDATKFGQVVVE
ncbi:MAG: plastocyanin/azurin family copper-binding protein [archaeon]